MQKTTQKKPTYEELEAKVLFLELELDKLRRMIFGQKRELYVPGGCLITFKSSMRPKEVPVVLLNKKLMLINAILKHFTV